MTTYTYDAINRITRRQYSNLPATVSATPAVNYKYDFSVMGNGRLTSVTLEGSAEGYYYDSYDAMGRLMTSRQITGGVTYPMSYVYDFAGNVTSESYPSGRVIATSYDAAGRIASVSGQKTGEPNRTYASQMSYAPHGAVAQCTYGNNLIEQTTFNSRLQPTVITVSSNPFPYLPLTISLNYGTTNNNGNVLSQTISGKTQSYTYDEVNRLKTAEEGGGQNYWKQEFDYDRFGNRRFNANTTANVLGPNPQIDQTTNRFLTSEGYIYDEAGNLRQEPGKSYKYDAESRLTEFNNGSALYFYDGDGRRVKKAAGTDVTVFVYNIAGQLVAEYRNTPVELGGGTSFVTLDHLGSIRMITHLSGDIKSRHDYLPFGEELTVGRTAQNYYLQADGLNQKFTGKERDEESGLDYFGARYYSSATGRFTAVDPGPFAVADPQSFNRFVYVQNNPLKFIDPTGRALYITGQYADEVVRMLERATGYTLHRDPKTGQVTVVSGTKRKEEKTSKSLAQKLGAVIDDDAKVNVNTVKDGSDREGNGIFIDDFKSRTVDVADLNKIIEEGHFDFAAVSLGHVLEEYFHAAKTGSEDFDSAHEKGLEFEGQVLSDFTNKTEGKPSEIQGRMNPAFTPGAVRVETHKFIYSSVLYDVVLKVSIKTFDVPTGKVSYDRSVKSIEKKDK